MAVPAASPPREPTIAEIDREIKRRQDDIARMRRTQETLEDERDVPKQRIAEIDELIRRSQANADVIMERQMLQTKVDQLSGYISRNIQTCREHQAAITTLENFKKAKLLLKQGLPPGLIRS